MSAPLRNGASNLEPQAMKPTAMLADHLESFENAILTMWREIATREGDVPRAQQLSDWEFRDHIPLLLDRLGDRLRERYANSQDEGREHGRVRWRQGYDIAQLTRELGHLRATLTRATFDFAQDRKLDLNTIQSALDTINDVMDDATADSVAQFQRESETHKRASRAEIEKRQSELEIERRTAEAERLKLRIVLDSLPIGVWVLDARGMVVHVNRVGERLQGFPRDEVVGRLNLLQDGDQSYRLLRADGSQYQADQIPASRALRGEVIEQEEILWRQDDQTRVITVSAAPIRDLSGAIVGAIATVVDITVRKQMEERLRRQNEFTTAVTDSMGEGLYAVNDSGRITYMNPASETLLGWTAAELIDSDQTVHEAIHHVHADGTPFPAEDCPIWGAFGRRESFRCDTTLIRKDGSRMPVSFTMRPLSVNFQFSGAVVTFDDITERQRLQDDLADSEARFRTITEQSPVLIWRSGVDATCDYFNQTWLEFRGRCLEQEQGDGWAEGVHPEDHDDRLKTYLGSFDRHEPFHITYRLRRYDGAYRWIDDHGTPLFSGRGEFLGFLGSCIDVTERVELEAALRRQRTLAEEASQHKTRLMSALSHDARTPLNAVALSAQLLEMHLGEADNPEVRDCLRMIRQSVKNVHDLLRDLLNLSRIDAGAVRVEPSRFAASQVLEECLSGITPQARGKGIEVRLEAGPLADAALWTDRAKLKQILSNLLSNALRFTESGHIRVFGERDDEQLRIGVEDTGIGIKPADHERIFDEFATLDNPHRPTGEGTGLGLAIGRRLANLLGGQILLTSEPGEGSTFQVALPATLLAEDQAEVDAPTTTTIADVAKVTTDVPTVRGSILIAEDDLTNRQALARLLRRLGYCPIEASNGREALTHAARERPQAILMDVLMPVMDGIDATRALRANPETRGVPIFALTGDVTLVGRQRIAEAGVDGFLEKPIDPEELRKALVAITAGNPHSAMSNEQ